MLYVVDTHALIWFLEGNARLGINAQAVLSNLSSRLILPAIALAEAVWILERGKFDRVAHHQVNPSFLATSSAAIPLAPD